MGYKKVYMLIIVFILVSIYTFIPIFTKDSFTMTY